VNHWEGLGAF